MSLKLFAILLSLVALLMLVLSVQDPYFLSFKAPVANIENIQISSFNAYELNATKVNSNIKAKKWLRYDDKDVLEDFLIKTQKEQIAAIKAIKMGDDISLKGQVFYKDTNQTSIKAKELFYNTKDKILISDDNFTALIGKNTISGKSLSYDTKKKILKIKEPRAWFLD